MRRFTYLLLPLLASPAFAQDYSGMQSRLDRLERDLTFIQRQVYQGGDPNAMPATALPSGASGAAAQTQLMQMQEEMRKLRGQVEQAEYRASQAESNLKRLQEDVDFRLQRLEQQAATAATTPAPDAPDVPATDAAPAAAPTPKPRNNGFNVNEGAGSARYEPEAAAPEAAPAATKTGFASPREHYNHAYKLLNDAKYADAAASFAKFTQDYPDDALVPNAYYWMGESYYARRDFSQAAEGFRKGYEAGPKSQKAADNLLKLSLSLANLKRQDEACIVLKQVSAQYSSQTATAAKADSEYKRLGCA